MKTPNITKLCRALTVFTALFLLLCLPGCGPNPTKQLLAKHPIERISVDYITPFAPALHYRYEITPDLMVKWIEYDPNDLSDEANIWNTHEKTISQKQYNDIVKAITSNDFLSMPEEHEPWQGADGPSQTIEIEAGGTRYHSGGYHPVETSEAFSKIWNALASAGVFSQNGYGRMS